MCDIEQFSREVDAYLKTPEFAKRLGEIIERDNAIIAMLRGATAPTNEIMETRFTI